MTRSMMNLAMRFMMNLVMRLVMKFIMKSITKKARGDGVGGSKSLK